MAEGFYAIIPPGALENFDENELELLVCGMPEIQVCGCGGGGGGRAGV